MSCRRRRSSFRKSVYNHKVAKNYRVMQKQSLPIAALIISNRGVDTLRSCGHFSKITGLTMVMISKRLFSTECVIAHIYNRVRQIVDFQKPRCQVTKLLENLECHGF